MLKKWASMILLPILLQLQMAAGSSVYQDPTPHLAMMKKREGCNINKCGDVYIPYPFGIGPECYYNHFFEITCDTSSASPTPFLTKLNLQVIDLTDSYYDQQILVTYVPAKICKGSKDISGHPLISLANMSRIDSESNPYSSPEFVNDLVVSGSCNTGATISHVNGSLLRGCTLLCNESTVESSICQIPIPFLEGMESYHINMLTSNETAALEDDNVCVEAGLAMSSGYSSSNDFNSSNPPAAYLQWTGKGLNRSNNVKCITKDKIEYCQCRFGYYGNPYLQNGCQVPKECIGCGGNCVPYNYYYEAGQGVETRYRCDTKPLMPRGLASGLAGGIGLVIGGYLLYRSFMRLIERRRRSRNFKQNGGLLLQHMTSNEFGFVEKSVIFTAKVLNKATDSFNKKRIIGDGGQGTVYKGMLADGRIVAIKKAKKVDANQSREFINEVVILSQANHRNIVKLLGCCLETEVPLLVYEYVPNGTLSDHIHSPEEDFHVTWQMRLRIAREVAEALAYLHSSSSTPVFHRDIKSKNILLDEKYRAKIADFGISRSVLIDQTHLTTRVVGTFGYLDPEYFRSHQFTGKSDVYSFGIVLLELLTSKKPIRETQSGGKEGLAEQFLHLMESSNLDDILDPCFVEGNKGELLAVAKLAAQCLKMTGNDRPTMKEVAMTLEAIGSQQPWSLGNAYQEVESDARELSKPCSYRYLSSSSFSKSSIDNV